MIEICLYVQTMRGKLISGANSDLILFCLLHTMKFMRTLFTFVHASIGSSKWCVSPRQPCVAVCKLRSNLAEHISCNVSNLFLTYFCNVSIYFLQHFNIFPATILTYFLHISATFQYISCNVSSLFLTYFSNFPYISCNVSSLNF